MNTTEWKSVVDSYQSILLDRNGDVFRITLNRPDALNALDTPMFEEIPKAIALANTQGARALLITGAGRAFCSGADLQRGFFQSGVAKAEQQASAYTGFVRVLELVKAINRAPMPVISAINGVAAGGGVGVSLAGDIALMARSSRFVLTFLPKLGLVPDVAATWLMTRMIGRARALGASLTGDSISAETAERWGLVWQCVDDAQLQDTALQLARRLADGPQAAVLQTRRLIDAATETAIAEHLELERETQCQLLGSSDNIEGVMAFREKRTANFRAG